MRYLHKTFVLLYEAVRDPKDSESLLDDAGLRLVKVWKTPRIPAAVLEGPLK
jgi:hypothetical protein